EGEISQPHPASPVYILLAPCEHESGTTFTQLAPHPPLLTPSSPLLLSPRSNCLEDNPGLGQGLSRRPGSAEEGPPHLPERSPGAEPKPVGLELKTLWSHSRSGAEDALEPQPTLWSHSRSGAEDALEPQGPVAPTSSHRAGAPGMVIELRANRLRVSRGCRHPTKATAHIRRRLGSPSGTWPPEAGASRADVVCSVVYWTGSSMQSDEGRDPRCHGGRDLNRRTHSPVAFSALVDWELPAGVCPQKQEAGVRRTSPGRLERAQRDDSESIIPASAAAVTVPDPGKVGVVPSRTTATQSTCSSTFHPGKGEWLMRMPSRPAQLRSCPASPRGDRHGLTLRMFHEGRMEQQVQKAPAVPTQEADSVHRAAADRAEAPVRGQPIPSLSVQREMATKMEIHPTVLQVWFKNYRARVKRARGGHPQQAQPEDAATPQAAEGGLRTPSPRRNLQTPRRPPQGAAPASLVYTHLPGPSFQLWICPSRQGHTDHATGHSVVHFGCCRDPNVYCLSPILDSSELPASLHPHARALRPEPGSGQAAPAPPGQR
ncbi:Divergent paired-related homeobox, partial [Galemys pyrenaicus]